jgi:hypothetical protein
MDEPWPDAPEDACPEEEELLELLEEELLLLLLLPPPVQATARVPTRAVIATRFMMLLILQ